MQMRFKQFYDYQDKYEVNNTLLESFKYLNSNCFNQSIIYSLHNNSSDIYDVYSVLLYSEPLLAAPSTAFPLLLTQIVLNVVNGPG